MTNDSIIRTKQSWKQKRNEERLLSIANKKAQKNESQDFSSRGFVYFLISFSLAFFWTVVVFFFLSITSCSPASASVIDLKKIAQIESSGCKFKNGDLGMSLGCYQVKDALTEWNNFHPKQKFTKRQMLNDAICLKVADWYLHKRIPQMIRAHKKKVTVRNILVSYNAGILYVVKNKKLPVTTINYLKKYGV